MAEKQCNLLKNGGGMSKYSTSEKEVGYDADGSIIYERTWYADSVNISSSTTIDGAFLPALLKRIDSIDATLKMSNGSWVKPGDITVNGTRYQMDVAVSVTDGLVLTVQNRTLIAYHITIRYVKN